MKKVVTVVPLMLLMLQSCNIIYHQVSIEKTYENSTLTTKAMKLKSTGRNCLSKEITTKKDTLNNQMTYKEVVTLNCTGAYSYEIKRKTWTLVNGKKVVTVSKKGS